MSAVTVRVRYFAAVRERLGSDGEALELAAGSTVGQLWRALVGRHAALDGLRRHIRIAVNLDFAGDDMVLRDGDEIALVPPVAGGTPRAELLDRPLDAEALVRRVRRDEHGGIVTFVGVVRNHSQGRAVSWLEYEAYPEMAVAKLESICDEVGERWPGAAVAVSHRVGRLEIGDAAVAIAVSAPHRKEAFAACQHVIDRIKEDVPIWKREVGPDGSEWVGMGS